MKNFLAILALLLPLFLHGQEFRNRITINTLHLLHNTYTINYEYKVKSYLGLSFPVSYNKTVNTFYGVNPKFYFEESKNVSMFAGPTFVMGNMDTKYFTFILTSDIGINLNIIRYININVSTGVGYRWTFRNPTEKRFVINPVLSVGVNF